MIDPVTIWFEIVRYNDKKAYIIANLWYKWMLCGYPRPVIITYDSGNELLGHVFKNDPIKNEYWIKTKYDNIKNAQEKIILEWIHQVIASIVH